MERIVGESGWALWFEQPPPWCLEPCDVIWDYHGLLVVYILVQLTMTFVDVIKCRKIKVIMVFSIKFRGCCLKISSRMFETARDLTDLQLHSPFLCSFYNVLEESVEQVRRAEKRFSMFY